MNIHQRQPVYYGTKIRCYNKTATGELFYYINLKGAICINRNTKSRIILYRHYSGTKKQ